MRIGVLGGTFDPVHLGHIMIAEEARERLSLVKVIMVPAGQPLTRDPRVLTPAEHRLEMLRLAVAGKPYLEVSTLEIERPGPSYTVDTVGTLKNRYGAGAEIYFILGWDSLAQIGGWHEPTRLIKLCLLAAVPRPGYPRPDMQRIEEQVPGISGRTVFLQGPLVDISATMIRQKVRRSEPINGLVMDGVARYIEKHGLYLQ